MIRTLVLFLFMLACIPYGGFAQNKFSTKSKRAIKSYNLALNKYQQRDFNEAEQYVLEALDNDSMFVEAYLFLADIANYKNNLEQEIYSYEKVLSINPEFFKYTTYNLGKAYLNNGNYVKAINMFEVFVLAKKGREKMLNQASDFIKRCEFAIQLKNNPVKFSPHNLGSNINNKNDQYWPSLSLNGETLIYTELLTDSSRMSQFGVYYKQEDFFISEKDNGGWQPGIPIGPPLNTPGNEGAHKLSADGNTIAFTGCNRHDGFGNCDIYFSHKNNGEWTVPKNAGRAINTPYSEKQPCLSPDGRYLFFSSNRPDGKGGMDLYVSVIMSDGNWATPINMGNNINTAGDEISPFIHADNLTLYFSSNGHYGLGNRDIFFSRIDTNNLWTKPENIGYPINTHNDEIGLVIDAQGEMAYYSTNSQSNSTDIYSFEMPQNARPTAVSYLSGRIFDKETNKALKAEFQLVDLLSGDTVMQSLSNANTGKYLVCLPVGKNYALSVNYPGYLFYSVNFDLNDSHSAMKPFLLDIPLEKIDVGNSVVLKNIFFELNSYELIQDSEYELNKIYRFIINNPQLSFEIGGYTDNQGDKVYNIDLSTKRAKAVFDYLVKRGLNKDNLMYKGYGMDNPLDNNDTEEGRANNRRTELKIIGHTE